MFDISKDLRNNFKRIDGKPKLDMNCLRFSVDMPMKIGR